MPLDPRAEQLLQVPLSSSRVGKVCTSFLAETFTMASTSMITPTGGRRGRGLKPMNSEPTMKGPGKGSGGAAGGSSLRVDTSSPQKKNAGTVQNMMAMSTGRMVSTPASIKRSGLLEDSPDVSSPIERSREQETGDLALGSLDSWLLD